MKIGSKDMVPGTSTFSTLRLDWMMPQRPVKPGKSAVSPPDEGKGNLYTEISEERQEKEEGKKKKKAKNNNNNNNDNNI